MMFLPVRRRALLSLTLCLPLALSTAARAQQPVPETPAAPAPAAQASAVPTAPAPPATLLKLGLDAARTTVGYWGTTVPLYAGAERQLGRHWSLTADANVGLGFGNHPGSAVQLAHFGAAAGARYYYNQARRQRLGKAVRVLGGTYLQLQGVTDFTAHYYYFNSPGPAYRNSLGAEVLWGYQRRLGRYGFVDAGAGVRVSSRPRYVDYYGPSGRGWSVEPVLRLRAGLAF